MLKGPQGHKNRHARSKKMSELVLKYFLPPTSTTDVAHGRAGNISDSNVSEQHLWFAVAFIADTGTVRRN